MKKALSLLLAIVMVIGMLPMSALAAERKGGKITFETTFTEEMGVGDAFTVTATLSETPGIASFTNSLKWNPDVVEFNGFAKKKNGKPQTEVFASDCANVFNDETGIATSAADFDNEEEGILYVAEFTIIAEKGALGLGLVTTEHGAKFTFAAANGDDIDPEIDFSAISGLTVGGKAPGATMPEDAPFTAVTTNKGDAIEIQEEGEAEVSVWGTPHAAPLYNVVVPAGATYADVTLTVPLSQMVTYDDGGLAGYYGPAAGGEGNGASFEVVTSDDASTTIRIPMEMEVTDWSGNTESFSLVKNEDGDYYVAGPEDAAFAAIAYFSFEYAEGGEPSEPETPVEKFSISVDPNLVGGTIKATDEDGNEITKAAEGDYVFVTVTAAEGYTTNGAYYINGEIANDFMFQMPGEAVVLTANFTKNHTHEFTKEVAEEKFYVSEATCEHGAVYYKSCECGEKGTETFNYGETVDHVYENGACKWCGAAEPVQTPGYRFATSADVTGDNGDKVTVSVKVTGHSDETVTTYNAYDITLTFDTDKLEPVMDGETCEYSGAVKADGGSVTVSGNTIRIVGCGDAKEFSTAVATLSFMIKEKAEGSASVNIDKVQVSDKDEAVRDDAPEANAQHGKDDTSADETPAQTVITVPFSVTKDNNLVSGEDKILGGEDYTFSFTDPDHYDYTELTVTVNGETVEVTPDENGVYTVGNVTGPIVITVKRDPKSYKVTVNGAEASDATYGQEYKFTLTPDEGYEIETIAVTVNGEEIGYTISENGEYVIAAEKITGEIVITFTQKLIEVPETKYTEITFSGITEEEIEGGLTQKVEAGKDFTFTLKPVEGYTYVVKIGDDVLTANEDGTYTIPAEKMIEGQLTVSIAKTETVNVEVAEYVKLDGKVMWLVTAKSAVADSQSVLKYGEDVMYTSEKYAAYSWLVISAETEEAVKAAAVAAITVAETGTTAPAVAYDCDVNGTSKVDVNDAQLAYDMYNASYGEFTESLTVEKFLEADMDGSKKLDTQDVAAIIDVIVKGNNA